MPREPESWTAGYFAPANPLGPDLPADTPEKYGDAEIQDIAFRMEIGEDGEACPAAAFCFHGESAADSDRAAVVNQS